MPLNNAQRDVIESAIEIFFYDMPNETSALIQFANYFSTVFKVAFQTTNLFRSSTAAATTPYEEKLDHEQEKFLSCVSQPEKIFKQLEKQNSNITVGEVQEFILLYVVARFIHQLRFNNVDFDIQNYLYNYVKDQDIPNWCRHSDAITVCRQLQWDLLATLKLFANNVIVNDHDFKSHEVPRDYGWYGFDWSIPIPKDQIYTAEIIIREEYGSSRFLDPILFLYLDLKVTIPKISKEFVLKQFRPFPSTGNDQQNDVLQLQIKEDAAEQSRRLATAAVLDYFTELYWEEDPKEIDPTLPGVKLVTHNHYFDLLDREKLALDTLCELNQDKADTLLHESVILLMRDERKILSFDQAKNLNLGTLNIIKTPFYLDKILTNQITLNDIGIVTKNKSRFLTLPSVIYLQAKNLVPFKSLLRLSPVACDLIRDNCYFELLCRMPQLLPLYDEITHKQLSLLQRDNVRALISRDIISLPELISDNATLYPLFRNEFYCEKLLEKSIIFDQIRMCSVEQVANLLSLGTMKLIDEKLLTIDNFLNLSSEKIATLNKSNINDLLLAGVSLDIILASSQTLIDLLEINYFYKQVLRGQLLIETLSKLSDETLSVLANLNIVSLLKEGLLNFELIEKMPFDLLKRCSGDKIYNLLLTESLTLHQVAMMSIAAANAIEQTGEYFNVLLLSDNNFQPYYAGLKLWSHIATQRLYQLFLNQPQFLPDQEFDSPEKLMQHILLITAEENIPLDEFIDLCAKEFCLCIKSHLQLQLEGVTEAHIPLAIKYLLQLIDKAHADQHDGHWLAAFKNMLTSLQTTLTTISLPPVSTLFGPPVLLTTEGIQHLKEGLGFALGLLESLAISMQPTATAAQI